MLLLDADRAWDGDVPDPDCVEIKRVNRRSGDQKVFLFFENKEPPDLLASCSKSALDLGSGQLAVARLGDPDPGECGKEERRQ